MASVAVTLAWALTRCHWTETLVPRPHPHGQLASEPASWLVSPSLWTFSLDRLFLKFHKRLFL